MAVAPVLSAAALTAILGAYPPEVRALDREFLPAGPERVATVDGIRFAFGTTDGRPVVVFRAGMSLVNAAFQLQVALDHFPIDRVLFAGVAGGVDPSLAVGDVVVPERWAYHAEAAYLNPDGQGGFIVPHYLHPALENYGMIFPDSVATVRDGESVYQSMPFFPADPALLSAARRAVANLAPIRRGTRTVRVLVGGTGVSGPVFLDNAAYREWIFRVWQARCVDMESTAYAQVCWANHKPLLVVRGLSDLAGGQKAPNPIDANQDDVSVGAARVLHAILDQLAP